MIGGDFFLIIFLTIFFAATGLADESTIRQSTKRRERELEDTQVCDYLAAIL